MRKLLVLLPLLLVLVSCTDRALTPRPGHYVLSSPAEDASRAPSLTLVPEEKTLTFFYGYDVQAVYQAQGVCALADQQLICRSSDGGFTCMFRVVDENTLAYDAARSDALFLLDDRMQNGERIADGSVFLRKNE